MNKISNKYELIIIGGGSMAFAAANRANMLKKKTLMINDDKILPLGGTCVNVGCVPSKVMLHQGEEYFYPLRSKFRAIKMEGKADFVEALKETREMVLEFRKKNYSSIIEKQKYVDLKEGRARFIDEHTVKVGKEEYSADYFIIATGASTFVPPIKGIEKVDLLTNVNVFNLTEKPKSVIIMGGGPSGMEFSQIFHHFGIKVVVVQRSDNILTKYDPIVGEELKKHLEEEGIEILTGVEVKEIMQKNDGVKVDIGVKGKGGMTLYADKLFLGTGLSPHTKDLGADKANIKLNEKGFVVINDLMQTSQEHIYAGGDVCGLMPLETTAAKQGNMAVLNMFENAGKKIAYNEIPMTVFTSPEVAAVGITEQEYTKKYKTCLCSTIKLDHVEKALAIKDTRGLIRMVLDHKNKQVIGVQIVGPMAADIITTATYAVKNKMTIDDIKDTVHVFPTLSEMIKKVAQSFDQNLDDMACCVE